MSKRDDTGPEETAPDSKAELQQRMDEARESISQTVEEIKGTVEEQISAVRDTVSGVLSIREQFLSDPVAWSLGALSAGFAIGYTLGYAHKQTRASGGRPSPLAVFANDLAGELSTLGKTLVLPSLDARIRASFGFDLSSVLEEIAGKRARTGSPRTRTKRRAPTRTKQRPPKTRRR